MWFNLHFLIGSLFISLQPQPPPGKQKSPQNIRPELNTHVKPLDTRQSKDRKRSTRRSPDLHQSSTHLRPEPRLTTPSHVAARTYVVVFYSMPFPCYRHTFWCYVPKQEDKRGNKIPTQPTVLFFSR